jgi:hypothetical protein
MLADGQQFESEGQKLQFAEESQDRRTDLGEQNKQARNHTDHAAASLFLLKECGILERRRRGVIRLCLTRR